MTAPSENSLERLRRGIRLGAIVLLVAATASNISSYELWSSTPSYAWRNWHPRMRIWFATVDAMWGDMILEGVRSLILILGAYMIVGNHFAIRTAELLGVRHVTRKPQMRLRAAFRVTGIVAIAAALTASVAHGLAWGPVGFMQAHPPPTGADLYSEYHAPYALFLPYALAMVFSALSALIVSLYAAGVDIIEVRQIQRSFRSRLRERLLPATKEVERGLQQHRSKLLERLAQYAWPALIVSGAFSFEYWAAYVSLSAAAQSWVWACYAAFLIVVALLTVFTLQYADAYRAAREAVIVGSGQRISIAEFDAQHNPTVFVKHVLKTHLHFSLAAVLALSTKSEFVTWPFKALQ